jgi:hypothetical protein
MPSRYRRPVGPAERARREQATADKLTALHGQLADQVAALRTGEDWRRWLEVAGRFYRYSFNNTLLIAGQRPDATAVAGAAPLEPAQPRPPRPWCRSRRPKAPHLPPHRPSARWPMRPPEGAAPAAAPAVGPLADAAAVLAAWSWPAPARARRTIGARIASPFSPLVTWRPIAFQAS